MDVEVSKTAPAGWDDLVAADPRATFFHTTGWAQALCESGKGSEALYLSVRRDDRVVAGIPAVSIERGPVRVIASMPLGTYGGLLLAPGAPRETAEALADACSDLAGGTAVAAMHVMDESARLPSDLRGFDVTIEHAHHISLDQGYEKVWEAFRPSARNKVRKARKAGVTVRRAASEEDFIEYHDMLVECSARWGQSCEFGPEFFSFLYSLGDEAVQMWLAEHEGSAIGGDLNFVMHGRIMNWGNVSRDGARALAPNNLLHAAAMEAGAAVGCVEYDLGSSAGIEGVDAFKAAFGTYLVPLRRYDATKPWYRAIKATAKLKRLGGTQ